MRDRCRSKAPATHSLYAARGITVCREWQDFGAFREWAMANGYAPGLEVDRIDNDRGYSPANCRWATDAEQNRNKRSNVNITAFGETKCLTDWTKDPRCVVTRECIQKRLRRGFSPEEALTRAPR